MIRAGVAVTAATVAALVIGYYRSRRYRPFPAHGYLGVAALLLAEALMLRGVEPIATFFTPIAWSAYILIADGAVLALTNRSRLNDAPIVLARMAALSIPLWLIFEAYNLRLQNWIYTGVPRDWTGAFLGYGWSFATITPAMFETADLVEALLPPLPGKPWKVSPAVENVLIALGAVCLILPLVLPRHIAAYTFLLVWIGFVLLLDPVNKRLGLPSFLGDLSEGFRRRVYSFFLAGWICGWLWEFWNNWAAAKWHYIFPIAQNWKIFEMPVAGYLGFLPFALECFVMYVTAAWLAGWLKRVK
ncbi:MAG TPA: hypothetical protein VG322_14195 [Candidatus Acidoferrales bacterium]|jgi:hypothetical protein|nr:hypothetical protein [Candidatus Acidoferrales bacterium]